IVGGRSGSTGTGRPPSGGEADSCRCSGSACGSSRRSCWSGPCTNLASASRRLGTALMTPTITRAVMIVKQTMITMARATSAMAMSSFILVLLDLVGHQLERLGADRLDHLGALAQLGGDLGPALEAPVLARQRVERPQPLDHAHPDADGDGLVHLVDADRPVLGGGLVVQPELGLAALRADPGALHPGHEQAAHLVLDLAILDLADGLRGGAALARQPD